ncbi:MAG: sulfatase [Luteolibacter sp.]
MKKPIFLMLAFLGLACAHAEEQKHPYNVLLICTDDMRPDLGCYGNPIVQSPNIDRLAASGVRFDRAYCQYPLCNPSRISMLTGRQPGKTGMYGNRIWFKDVLPDAVSLPQYFKDNGFVTLRSGKIFHGGIDDTDAWSVGGEVRTLAGVPKNAEKTPGAPAADPAQVMSEKQEKGGKKPERLQENDRDKSSYSDQWQATPDTGEKHGDSKAADRAIEMLKKYKDQRFFMACGFAKPHSPLIAPQRFFESYVADKIPLPVNFAPRPTVPEGFPKLSIRPKNADLFIGRDATPEQAREMIRAYYACITFADWNVGRVISALDELGLREKTIIVFWSDHGYQLGERGKWSKAGSLFEQGARTPFIIDLPHARGNGQASSRVVEAVDIYPTLAELCGLPVPKELDGKSLTPLLDDPKHAWNRPAFTVWSENGESAHGVSIRNERWRYTKFRDGSEMLFDLDQDPQELKNVVNEPGNAWVHAELQKQIDAYSPTLTTGGAN